MSRTKKILLCSLLSGLALFALVAAPLPYAAVKRLVLAMPEQFVPELRKETTNSLLTSAIKFRLQIEFQRLLSNNAHTLTKMEQVSAQVTRVRDLMITQRQLDDVEIYWNASTIQSFVRGFGFCDQINGALALVLAPSFERSDLFALKKGGRSPHSLVRLRSPELGEFYADAWSDVPVFQTGQAKVPDLPGFESVRSKLQTTLPEIDESYLERGYVLNRYDFGFQVEKAARRTLQALFPSLAAAGPTPANRTATVERTTKGTSRATKASSRDARGGKSTVPARAKTEAARETPDPILVERYLIARLDHIYGSDSKARAGYDAIAGSGCIDDFCRLAREFLRRLRAVPSPS